ncbi:hypothetical protein MUK42_12097 [Musa troglodytarum]|uniref:Uncharacterized protein n=1 Tax=Musa troglodytarum TaxID=320322 RepID=A0A9E7KCM9_9LILI|nr:hypothetical protein MUK42_12097 [Musa troglodytarum]
MCFALWLSLFLVSGVMCSIMRPTHILYLKSLQITCFSGLACLLQPII